MKLCPRCETGLLETPVGDLVVDGCIGCGGVWFDNKELGAIARSSSASLAVLDEQFWPTLAGIDHRTEAVCPNCDLRLLEFEFPHSPGIKLDGCPGCRGIWVDNGELRAIHERLGQAGAEQQVASPPDFRTRARDTVAFLATSPCPHCSEPNPAASVACWACGGRLAGNRGLFCPRCDRPLTVVTKLGVRMDVCTGCGGVWLDGGELSVILTQDVERLQSLDEDLRRMGAVAKSSSGGALLCPLCNVPMDSSPIAGAELQMDSCLHCKGVWTDAGEFAPIARSLTGA